MTDFKKYIFTYTLLGVFIIAMLSMSFGIQTINGANETILDHPALATFNSSVGQQVETQRQTLNTQQNVTESDLEAFERRIFGDLLFGSFFTMLTRFISFPIDLISSFFTLASTVLGIPAVVLGTLVSLLVFAGIIAWYRQVKRG